MTRNQKHYVEQEAKEFVLPDHFAGGCQKSTLNHICVHFKPNGELGKIEDGCPYWTNCQGHRFKYNS